MIDYPYTLNVGGVTYHFKYIADGLNARDMWFKRCKTLEEFEQFMKDIDVKFKRGER